MKCILVGTYLYVARLNPRDHAHRAACEAVASRTLKFVTSEFVLLEVADGLCSPTAHARTAVFLNSIRENRATTIVPATSGLIGRATALYSAHLDKGWSLTDCTSFVIMGDEGISAALTGDIHYEQAGFHALLRDAT